MVERKRKPPDRQDRESPASQRDASDGIDQFEAYWYRRLHPSSAKVFYEFLSGGVR